MTSKQQLNKLFIGFNFDHPHNFLRSPPQFLLEVKCIRTNMSNASATPQALPQTMEIESGRPKPRKSEARMLQTQLSIKKASMDSQYQIKKTIKNNSKKTIVAAFGAVLLATVISITVCLVIVQTRTMHGNDDGAVHGKNGQVLGKCDKDVY